MSSHAQNRVVDPTRDLKKSDMTTNLFGKAEKSKKYKKNGTLQYDRLNKKSRTITYITADDKVVKTIRKYHNNKKAEEKEIKILRGR